jgi:hypothetical protein
MKRIVFGLLIILALPVLAAAQGKGAPGQKLILEFVDGPDLTVTASDKSVSKYGVGIVEQDAVPVGATITTGPSTTAELRLKPNGTIIKIAKSTSFTVAGLATTAKGKNAFALVAGKIRAVAAKGAQYEVSSRTAVCAVRGTDFSFAYEDGAKAVLMVAKGLVQFDKLDDAGASVGTVPVAAGELADAFAATFASAKYSPEQFAEQFGDVGFTQLKESDVPDKAVETAEPAAESPPVSPENSSAAPAPAASTSSTASAPESPFVTWLKDALGFEIGSVTIDNDTYAKAVIQPNLSLGKLKLGLYLPIIYKSDLFNSSDWYHPDGNDEWSFGSVQFAKKDYADGALDLAKDVALKIKYFEYGIQYQDPFFIKVGNLEDMTLGHGLIMRNYANDTDFPSMRRLGFDMGLDMTSGGFELVTNDLTNPEIFGARVFMRPIEGFKLALGASAVVDWNPASVLDSAPNGLDLKGLDLKLISTGVDLDLPIVKSSLLGITVFADGAVTLPYLANDYNGISSGLKTELVWNDNKLKNWGAAGGLLGNVLFIDWRLEYRYFTGNFRPSLFDTTYDRMRGQYAVQYLGYLKNPSSYNDTPTIMGIYGEGGFKFLKEKLSFTLGYMWPWSPDAVSLQDNLVKSSDEFHARLAIKKGLIPIVNLAGAVTYDRRGIAQAIANKSFVLLDSNTTFGGEIDVPVPKTPNLDLALIFQTQPVLKADGSIDYNAPGADPAKGIPALKPSFTIETRFHF